ncbi:uncharacterized protein LOC126742467 [Anthonomus grandis grandis]|uniref:uncharacterized protein LOC126742467 n=1 Tax=Anthonomus grandis grandis TaxID=2921223 RepID=UPI0021650137|nr:uncharacterized protein LOC126742467 [Anthonomus grandis grandis]
MFMGSSIGSFEVDFDSMYDGIVLEENLFGYKPSAVYSITLKNCLVDTAVLKNLTGKGVLLSGLTRLDLSYNLLLTLDSGIFSKTPKLQQLYLISSGINTIELGTFDGLSDLIMLYLTNNNLKTLPNGLFNDLTAILSFFIDGNPWNCECNMQWFKDFLGKLPPLDYKRCRDGSGWVNMDDVEFCPDNSTSIIATSSTGKSTSTEAIQTSTIHVPTNDFIFEKIICRNLLMYNDEINHSTLWLESTFKRRNIKYLFSEITNPSIFILNLDAKLTSNDFFIWTNVQNRSDYGCVFNISSIITMNLRYDETYTLCFLSNDTTDPYALIAEDCTAVKTPPDWSHRPWLLNSQKIIVIVIALLTTLASIVISSVIVYFLIKYNPELLKGNKRVLIVKRGSYSPNVLVMPNEKKQRHISLCTDNEGYLAPKLKPHWKTPDKKYMDFDNFSDGSVFLDNEDKGLEREIYEPPPVPPNHPMKRRDSVKPYFYSLATCQARLQVADRRTAGKPEMVSVNGDYKGSQRAYTRPGQLKVIVADQLYTVNRPFGATTPMILKGSVGYVLMNGSGIWGMARAKGCKTGETPPESKRPRKKPRGPRREPGLFYRDAAAGVLRMAITAKKYPEAFVSEEQANTLKGWLLNKTLALQSGSQIAPKFAGSTKNWLVELVQKETPWEGAKLQIKEDGKLPRPVKAITWLPGPTEEPKALLHKLDDQNNINTSLWKVLDMRKDQDDKGCLVTLLIDEKSWAKVREANQSLYLNFGSINIRLSASIQEKEKRDQATPMETGGIAGNLFFLKSLSAMGARLIQINLHHCKAATAALQKCIADNNIQIALIQEPYTYRGQIRGLGNLRSKYT